MRRTGRSMMSAPGISRATCGAPLPPPRPSPASGRGSSGTSLGLDIRFANDAAVVVELPGKSGSELRPARPDGIEALDGELLPDLGYLHRRAKPSRELGDRLFRGPRRGEHPEPDLVLGFLMAGVGGRRHV